MFSNFSHRIKENGKSYLSFLIVLIALIYLSGCSTSKHHEVLSFFFDGVPDTEKVIGTGINDSTTNADTALLAQGTVRKEQPQMVMHSPYQDKQCNTCHDQGTMGKLLKSQPALCYQCHEDFSKKYKVLHGPVGGGQCTMCHSPHMSANADLLKRTSQDICLYCHSAEDVLKTKTHQNIKETNCTECHNPHGGDDQYVLR